MESTRNSMNIEQLNLNNCHSFKTFINRIFTVLIFIITPEDTTGSGIADKTDLRFRNNTVDHFDTAGAVKIAFWIIVSISVAVLLGSS